MFGVNHESQTIALLFLKASTKITFRIFLEHDYIVVLVDSHYSDALSSTLHVCS